MYQAIPYSAGQPWPRPAPTIGPDVAEEEGLLAASQQQASTPAEAAARVEEEEVRRAVAECPVLVVGVRGCCLSHVVKRLLQGLGVNPAVHEVAGAEADLAAAGVAALPAVFVGGRLLGGLDRLMAAHISGDLVPILKDAGALWL
ncbi:Monothiol glutaredoxin-S5 [Zea mays]|jgi:glutaredoxin 3|uniref:Grx_I1-glutaredoxin subgroup III n=2 Tax=Zea mays TaxID=4577 RepID=A0A1D6MCV5_MAIZE|nr:monothiol glutaredoxin-S9 [Zea mays]AQK88516.1 Grx_I1-glutaredoxin subgroup III [Zea mays]PWZ16748.1 Monothiol glutaredoxin-S5 [Zea mays]|eukprot:XP_020395242.1 monothiol glutaredoxin-S9 [Zea mays]